MEWLVAEAARPRTSAEERARLLASVRWLGTQSACNVHFLLRASAGDGDRGGSVSDGGVSASGSVGVGGGEGSGGGGGGAGVGTAGGVASDSCSGGGAMKARAMQRERYKAEALLRAAHRGEVALYGRPRM